MGKVAKRKALDIAEQQRFKACCDVVDGGVEMFLDVGNALMEIQADKLYREESDSFDVFVKGRWGFDKSYTYRLIGSAKVVENLAPLTKSENGKDLSPIGDTSTPACQVPQNEAQARPLTKLTPAKQREAWKLAVEKADGHPVTAAVVAKAAKEVVKPPVTADDVAKSVGTIGKKPPENGKQKVDHRKFLSVIEYVGRALPKVDDLNKSNPHGNLHRQTIAHLKAAVEALEQWHKGAA